MSSHHSSPARPARVEQWIRRLAVPIALFWLAAAAVTNVTVPPLEKVAEAHDVSLSAQDAPSLQATKHIGKVFGEFDSDSAAMIVLEGDQPLGADAHRFSDTVVRKLSADTRHIQHIQNFWGDPLTAAGSQRVRPRPASRMLRPYGSRRAVRQLLAGQAATAQSPSS